MIRYYGKEGNEKHEKSHNVTILNLNVRTERCIQPSKFKTEGRTALLAKCRLCDAEGEKIVTRIIYKVHATQRLPEEIYNRVKRSPKMTPNLELHYLKTSSFHLKDMSNFELQTPF